MKEALYATVGTFCAIGLLFLVILFFATSETCTDRAKVISIGGCDGNGLCGVMTDKGRQIARHPVVGKEACIKWKLW